MQVAIIGGNIAGLSAASFLSKLQMRCTILDIPSSALHAPRYIGIWTPALLCLSQLGTKHSGYPVGKSGYRSVKGDWLIQPSRGLQKSELRGPSLSFMKESRLINCLHETALEGGSDHRPMEVTSISFDTERQQTVVYGKKNEFGNCEQLAADLVIVADGAYSRLRQFLYPALSPLEYRGYMVYRGHTSSRGLSGRISEEAFQTWGPGARFACVPTLDGNAWFAAITASKDTKMFDFSLSDLRKKVFRNWHIPVQDLLSGTDKGEAGMVIDEAWAFRKYIPGGLSGVINGMPVAFVGDAGHTLDPILAQGAGIAIEDGARLAGAIGECTDALGVVDWTAALAMYETRRSRRLRPLHLLSNVSQALGHMESQALCSVRDSLLRLTPPFIKGRVMDSMIDFSLSNSP